MAASDRAAPVDRPSEASPKDPDGLVGKTVAGKYRVLEVLARGGMGRIYRAEQVPLGRPVALKVLHQELADGSEDSTGFQKRFLLEAASCAQLRHPNIVVVYDYGRLEESARAAYFMAMELIEGLTLAQILRTGPLEVGRALRITREVARALREAHRRGMVHRDLKPSNVMVVATPEGEQVKVLDFGLVKVARDDSEELTKEGHFLGSPKYMAPEQIRRGPIDGRADIYALGVILFHMLAGRVPFEGEQAVQTLIAHLNEPVPPLPARPGLTPAIEAIVRRCLAKAPEARFSSADELIRTIDDAAGQDGTTLGGASSPRSQDGWPLGAPTDGGDPTRTASLPSFSATQPVAADAPTRPARRRTVALAGMLIAVAGAGAALLALFASRPEPAPTQTPTPPASPAAPGSEPATAPASGRFTLFVASVPSGARVLRDGTPVGVTPTFVELDARALERTPARFEIALAGYASHVFTQGPSPEDVHVLAELQPLTVSPAGASAPADAPRSARRRPRPPPPSTLPAPEPPRGEEMTIKTRR